MVIKMQFGKRILLLLCAVLMLFSMFPAIRSGASSGPSLVTTLTDNVVQRGSKKNFDVWARNAGGEKIRATVTHNGTRLEPTWDDSEKASYTLNFTEEGENTVTVSASSDGGKKKQLTYRILYRRAEPGEEIGRAIWSVEAFTVGCGYIVEPTEVPIREGETAAEQLLACCRRTAWSVTMEGRQSPRSTLPISRMARHRGNATTVTCGARCRRNRAGWICPRRFRPF